MSDEAAERICRKIDQVRETQEEHGQLLVRLDERSEQHKQRMDRMERRAATAGGATGALVAIIATLVKAIMGQHGGGHG